MIIDLLGVYEDGNRRNQRLVPDNPRVALRVMQNATVTVRLRVLRASGEPLTIAADPAAAFALTVRPAPGSVLQTFTVAGTLVPTEGPERVNFALAASLTKNLAPGRYVYDVWMTFSSARQPVVPASPFLLEPSLNLT